MRTETVKENDGSGSINFLGITMALNGATATAMAKASESFGHRCMEWQQEMQGFISRRVKADMNLPTSFAACRNLPELAKVQQEWFVTATEAYLNGANRLTEISTAVVRDGMKSWLDAFQPSEKQGTPGRV